MLCSRMRQSMTIHVSNNNSQQKRNQDLIALNELLEKEKLEQEEKERRERELDRIQKLEEQKRRAEEAKRVKAQKEQELRDALKEAELRLKLFDFIFSLYAK